MKNTIITLMLFSGTFIFMSSCKTGTNETKSADVPVESNNVEASKQYAIDPEASSVAWIGSSMIGKEHKGLVKISEGTLGTKGNTVLNGKVVVDMGSIVNTDLSDPTMNAKLITHLKNADFFDTEKFPTATLNIKNISAIAQATESANNTVTADFTMKGVTKEISFPAMIKVSDIGVLASANFQINRKDWGVMYGVEGSVVGLAKDKVIKNEITIDVNLIAK